MCASIPGQIIEIVDPHNRLARVEISGQSRLVNLSILFPDLSTEEDVVGAWVLVQAGLAVASVSPEEASQMLELIEELNKIYKEEFS